MKISIRNMLVLAVVVLSLGIFQIVPAQAATTVEGEVYAVSAADSTLQVDEGNGTITTVYCVPFNRLANKYQIVLNVGDYVSLQAYERTFSNLTTKLVAISLTAENEAGQEVTVQLH